ncbi:YHS domain-containing (seleno)protein [Ekhidna sp.]|uniref:YHS domain-containing (seleno)protein n=1 Tax=Ekhidna sp. TaxID=2608089 RepID=UPI003BA86B10
MDAERLDVYHRDGIAINGYDVVAYFTKNQAIKGQAKYACLWRKVMWQFSSEGHLQMFSENPEKYVPQYGGFCAFGMSNGYKAKTKSESFSIIDGKLYLNFANYVKRRWTEKHKEHILSANHQWDKTKESIPIKAHPIPIWWKYKLLKLIGKDLFD